LPVIGRSLKSFVIVIKYEIRSKLILSLLSIFLELEFRKLY